MLNQENMPGAGSVADTIEFMKQMWSGVGAPSMAMPSLSVDDINKKITDLKTVASWLELNLNMLKATIQTLEVQSATLSTLQAMSAILASRGTSEPAAESEDAPASPFPFGFPMWPGMAPGAEDEAPQAQSAEPEADEAEPVAAPDEDAPVDAVAPEAGAEAVDAPPAPDFQSAMANPNAWWNLLQEQFTHAVGNALGSAAAETPVLKPGKVTKSGKPAKPGKVAKPGRSVKRSENKTVSAKAKPARSAAAKPLKPPVSKVAAPGKTGKKAAPAKPAGTKPSGRAGNTSASAPVAVVQSRQTKKPAPRKPSSP